MSRKKSLKFELLYMPVVVFLDLHNYYSECQRTTRLKNQKSGALINNVQKHVMYQLVVARCSVNILIWQR